MMKEYQNPQIRNDLTIEVLKEKKKIDKVDIPNSLLEELFTLLNGDKSTESILGTLVIAGYELKNITEGLNWLNKKAYIKESDTSDYGKLTKKEKEYFNNQINFFGSFRPSDNGLLSISKFGLASQVLLKEAKVYLIGSGKVANSLSHYLSEIGLGEIFVSDTLPTDKGICSTFIKIKSNLKESIKKDKPDLLIYCSDNYEYNKCLEYNQICLAENIPFLPYKRAYSSVEIGPLVLPNETACYYCADCRKRAASMYVEIHEENAIRESENKNLNFPIGIEYLALEVLKIISKIYEPALKNKLYVFNLMTGHANIYPIFKLPRCKHCGIHKINPRKKLWEI